MFRKVSELNVGDTFLETNNQIYTVLSKLHDDYLAIGVMRVVAESHPELHVREYDQRHINREVVIDANECVKGCGNPVSFDQSIYCDACLNSIFALLH